MLVIIRGLPGSGKSTLARMFEKQGYFHVEKDKLRVNAAGEYEYDRSKNAELERQCLKMSRMALLYSGDVVVSHVFTKLSDMDAWMDLADECNTPYPVIECKGRFKSVHGDDAEVNIPYPAENWEHYPVR